MHPQPQASPPTAPNWQHRDLTGVGLQPTAQAILRIIGTSAPARYYLVGPEKWYARLGRILPPSAMESLAARNFQLAK